MDNLSSSRATAGRHDTELTIQILDIKFEPIKNAKLKLEFDGKTQEMQVDADGLVSGILIEDHSKGIKVYFRGISGDFALIAAHPTLPLGRKKLTLTSRTMVVKGTYFVKPGAQRQPKKVLPAEIRAANKGVHIQPKGLDAKRAEPGGEPKPFLKETRVENGTPLQVAAAVYTEANLLLSPANEKYRKLIITSAQRYSFTPHTLAALIDAEAAVSKNGWDPNSVNPNTKASGLTQFVRGSWLEMIAEPRSLMNQRLKREHRFDQIKGRKDDGKYCLYGVRGGVSSVEEKLRDNLIEELLSWRFVPEYSIDTAALYGRINLEKLAKRGLNVGALAPEDLAKVMYLAHHEGAGGASKLAKGELDEDVARGRLLKQLSARDAAALLKRFNDKPNDAYTYWLYELLIDKKINVAHFMVKADGVSPRTMAQIAEALGGQTLARPANRIASKAPEIPAQAGAAEGWRDPLDSCVLRTAKLRSKKSATFGMTRIDGRTGKPRPHQGIDLVAVPGTPIYAVANGNLVDVNYKAIVGKGYGKTVTLAVDVNDLPTKQRNLILRQNREVKLVYFFYAHLTDIQVPQSENFVSRGSLLGTSGDTGNANGMTTIERGAHLHFEVRLKRTPGAGLSNRLDPRPFINHCD